MQICKSLISKVSYLVWKYYFTSGIWRFETFPVGKWRRSPGQSTKNVQTRRLSNSLIFGAGIFWMIQSYQLSAYIQDSISSGLNMVVLWTTKIRGVWELIKLKLFWLNFWELFRPVRLSWNTYATSCEPWLVMCCKTIHLSLAFEWCVLERCSKA